MLTDRGVDARRRHHRLRARGRDLRHRRRGAVAARRARRDRQRRRDRTARGDRRRQRRRLHRAGVHRARQPVVGSRTPRGTIVGITRGTAPRPARASGRRVDGVPDARRGRRDGRRVGHAARRAPRRRRRIGDGPAVADAGGSTRCPGARPADQETTSLGAAFLAGLAEGVWPSLDCGRAHAGSSTPSSTPCRIGRRRCSSPTLLHAAGRRAAAVAAIAAD